MHSALYKNQQNTAGNLEEILITLSKHTGYIGCEMTVIARTRYHAELGRHILKKRNRRRAHIFIIINKGCFHCIHFIFDKITNILAYILTSIPFIPTIRPFLQNTNSFWSSILLYNNYLASTLYKYAKIDSPHTIISIMTGCIEDGFTTSPSDQPLFSVDTLKIGTVFTDQVTPTHRFTVRNPHSKQLSISDINLSGPAADCFRLNVDGIAGKRFNAVDIRGKDSIFVFVEATFPEGAKPMTDYESQSRFHHQRNNKKRCHYCRRSKCTTSIRHNDYRRHTLRHHPALPDFRQSCSSTRGYTNYRTGGKSLLPR